MSKLSMIKSAAVLWLAFSASAYANHPVAIGLGSQVYNVTREAYATVIGVSPGGKFVLRFTSGPLSGQTGANWDRNDLAVLQGCAGDLCVGEAAYNVLRSVDVQIAGIQNDGRFVLRFMSGALSGQVGSKWGRDDLAATRGCSPGGRFCVGSRAYNVDRSAAVTVIAVQTDGRLVLRFDEGALSGQTGANWSESDLAVTEYTPVPQPPYYPQPHPRPVPPHVPGHGPRPLPPPVVVVPGGGSADRTFVCSTQSGGRSFSLPGRGLERTRAKVIGVCQASPYTDKQVCEMNAVCR